MTPKHITFQELSQRNRSVIDTINNRNIRNRAFSIVTYDFSIFFTNIPGI